MNKKRKINYTANVIKWFDKLNGNTYHSISIARHDDGEILKCGFTYGYGEQYKQTALEKMKEKNWIKMDNIFKYEYENNYPILWVVSHGLKRECVSNGKN